MSEFWPRDKWPSPPSLIPHSSRLLRMACRLTGGHRWTPFYWAEMSPPGWPAVPSTGWPAYDYCEKCWRFRDRVD